MTITQSNKRDVVHKISDLLQDLKTTDHAEIHQNWKNIKVKVTDRIARIELVGVGIEFEKQAKQCIEDLQKLNTHSKSKQRNTKN